MKWLSLIVLIVPILVNAQNANEDFFALRGVRRVTVRARTEESSPVAIDTVALRTHMELRARQSPIEVTPFWKADGALTLFVHILGERGGTVAATVTLTFSQSMVTERMPHDTAYATSWLGQYTAIAGSQRIAENVDQMVDKLMDQFLNEYLAVNPN
jgi:hypothetical protein